TTLTFGAEGVPVGMRVLVVGADGTPYPVVDEIVLKGFGTPGTDVQLKDVPLTTIDPPESWKRIQYHYMTPLPPTDPSKNGPVYLLQARAGKSSKSVTFTLGAHEFKQITLTLP